jgi:transposase
MTPTPPARNAYPTNIFDDEWALVAPCLTLMAADALQRRYSLREVFNDLSWIVRADALWRLLRLARGRAGQPSAASRMPGCCTRAPKAGRGQERRNGSKVHAAVDTLCQLLALTVTPANEDERTRADTLAKQIQAGTGHHLASHHFVAFACLLLHRVPAV